MASALFKKVLIATNLGPVVDSFIACFTDLKSLGVEEVILAHALPPETNKVPGDPIDISSPDNRLDQQAKLLRDKGVKVQPMIVAGPAGTAILELADRHNVGLVVVGTREETEQGRSLLGCTSYSVLHETVKPTLILPATKKVNDASQTDGSCLNHILFPTDFSETSEHAFLYVESLASTFPCEVTLYHVHDKNRIDPYLRDRLPEFDKVDRGRMERMKAHLEFNKSGQCNVDLAYGIPAQKILHLARSGKYSLMIIGTQGRGYIPEIHFGSTANAVARHAPINVLFVPMPR